MVEANGSGYLSIGEVLGLLLEEFPDVTISKIRFLESQGLISPERTASGYRKFYDDDVDLLRVILTEQRQNFLPLRVIKNRLESGEIDRTGEHLRDGDGATDDPVGDPAPDPAPAPSTPTDVPSTAVASHPAARARTDIDASETTTASGPAEDGSPTDVPDEPAPPQRTAAGQLLPGVLLDRDELCAMVGMTDGELDQLENFGVIQPTDGGGGAPVYGDDAVEVAKPACAFLRAGIDARHLRTFRTAAEREVSLYEQIITPRFRQRNPEARAEALATLRELDALGAKLRAALTKQALGPHFRS